MIKFFLVLFFYATLALAKSTITPSDVYTKVQQLHQEIFLIKEHFAIIEKAKTVPIGAILLPRNTYQYTYEIFVKLNIFRKKNNLISLPVTSIKPLLAMNPVMTYEQVLRLLEEVHIIKMRLGIKKIAKEVEGTTGKQPQDVYNALRFVSYELDTLNGSTFTPSSVFAEAMRIYEDMSSIYVALKMQNHSKPPAKVENALPELSYKKALLLLHEIQRLQRQVMIPTIELGDFSRMQKIQPSEVFMVTQLILAEMQTLKAYLGLYHTPTPFAEHYEGKKAEDVGQVLDLCYEMIKKISSLSTRRGV